MRTIFLLLFTILCITVNATTYYLSAGGNDSNNGTSSSTAWQTLNKLNSYFSSLKPGDNVLLNRGDIFYGTLTVNQSGSASSPITIGAYGSGANPVITGFTTVSSWTNLGSNIWESSSSVSTLSTLNTVVINGVSVAMGRTPNTGYYTYQSFSTNISITSSSANSATTNWTGAEAVINKNNFNKSKGTITAHSGTTISYSGGGQNGTNNFGFFIQNDVRTLDAQNEWYYNPSTKKIRIYSTGTPANVQVASVANAFYNSGKSYIVVDGIDFTGTNAECIYSNANSCTFQNCNITFAGSHGLYMDGASGVILNNYISDCGNTGIFKQGSNSTIKNNIIRNIGLLVGQAPDRNVGILYNESGGGLIYGNVLRNIGCHGFQGISSNSATTTIRKNVIDSFGLTYNDIGGIYTSSNKIVDSNIIENGIGQVIGTNNTSYLVEGIYVDETSHNCAITNNSVFNMSDGGIKNHKSYNLTITGNTIYNCSNEQLTFQDATGSGGTISGITLKNNIIVSRTAAQNAVYYSSSNNDITSWFSAADSNYYARPIDDNITFRLNYSGGSNKTLTQWQSYVGKDLHSNKSPMTVTTVNDIRFEYNATTSNKIVSLDASYIDVKGEIYSGSITLAPYSSIVLIKDGPSTNQSPKANAGADQTITLPTNSITFSGSGSDPDGTISSYQWTKISGPSGYTITNATSPGSPVTGLVQGVYQFQLKVTDNSGATGLDTMQVTVNAVANQPPVAGAGSDQTITLPTNSVTLLGSGTDPDGTISSYKWTELSGPSSYNIVNAISASTNVTGLVQGTYQFQLTVTDNSGATGTDVVLVTVNAAVNIAPIANAGISQIITLPVNTVTLSGSGTDVDGAIANYKWTKISGPPGYSIVNANSPLTDVTGLAQGAYQFQLTVTDNDGAIGTDLMLVTVNAAVNIAPTANAGTDQTISLPVNTVVLSGSGSDADGTVVSYLWTQISGPSSYTIVNPASAATSITSLVSGVYQFQLIITDNNGTIGTDVVEVMVDAAANIAPVADAGADQTITLPINTAALSGSGTDTDGTVTNYRWTQISGPSGSSILNASSATSAVTGLVAGVYKFQLEVTDNNGATGADVTQVTVNVAPNQPPVANAGSDQVITLPVSSITLSGSGSDVDGSLVSYTWTKISGPSGNIFANANSPVTDVTGLVQGTYQFQLEVTDNDGAIGTDIIQVIVNAAANLAPVANAGTDQTITLPVNTVTLSGSGSDADGIVASYNWTQISGPTGSSIVNANSPTTNITGLVQGVYQFQLEVTDSNGTVGTDVMQLTVNEAVNIPPVVDAGADQTITLLVNSVTLSGTASDSDGTIASYIWTKISGPTSYSILNSNSAITDVIGLMQGTYQFQLKVTDNNGATATDIVIIIVNPASNIPPTADAGVDQSITLPINTITLSGSGSDADGTVAGYLWTKISGPTSYNIVNANSPNTNITGLVQGTYQFQLIVTDNNGATGTDIMQVTVNAANNITPTANAGPDQIITSPVSVVTLSGNGDDVDGIIAGYTWTQISGPSGGNIVNINSPVTDVSGLTAGIYQFEFQVTDNNGATGTDIVQITVNPAANIPPVANAGSDLVITLPINTAALSGSGSDADGAIVDYQWTKISGPSNYNFVNANLPGTDVTGLVQGIYEFQLKVTDDNGATAVDTIQVTVNPATNIPPIANAGLDQVITLPVNSVILSGSGSDADGTVAGYLWTKISGPSSYIIVTGTLASTSVTGLVQGVYQFQLQVTDNKGATATDTMQVTINLAGNISPVANAGAAKTITLPVNFVTLSGSGTDVDGTVTGYVWTEISGPASYTIVNPNSSSTNITGLVQGVYQFQLQVTDNNGATGTDLVQITVNAALNVAPVANAGPDLTITLPITSVTLSGSGSDADGTVVSYRWIKISGPSSFTIVNLTSANTNINGLLAGVYKFQLTVTDNNGATDADIVQVTVNVAPNQLPTANAGPDQVITLPANSVMLAGSGADADGTIASYYWSKISGPTGSNIGNANSPGTNITGLVQGVYQFQLRVTDDKGAIGTGIMKVTVNPAPNQPPVANAGSNRTITLPVNSLSVSGSGSDADGTVVNYQWTKMSGPSTYNIANPTAATTNINNLVQGVYQFQLTVADNTGAIGTDIMQVIVNTASNQPPAANAGPGWTITLPTNSLMLSGSGSDPDGTVQAYQWTKISGPLSYNIVNPASAATQINGLVQGTYQFQLQVTDNNGATGTDVVQVTVNVAPNQPPVANAGSDKTIALPTNSLTVSGSGSDADGTISAYQWTKISGPSSYTIASLTSASTAINGLVQGIYQFQLKVTDNNGATATDVMQVTVDAAPNQAPVADAGLDKTITLPTNSLTVSGSGSDVDGTIASYQWIKISGPTSYNIVSLTTAATTIKGLVQGVYQFQLTVTDNVGATATDVMQVIVNAAPNQAPVANAGSDKTITLPTNSLTVAGSGSDADGAIMAYQWIKMSGPSSYSIASPSSASTAINGLVQGVYQFQLMVTDNSGATGIDVMQIIVNAAPNQPPVANAGSDWTVTLPSNSLVISGSGTDTDGTIVGYQWAKISGPSSYNIVNPTAAITSVNGLTEGIYQFQLRVTDNNGTTSTDIMQVTVNAAPNQPPVAEAGSDITITLPTNSVTLSSAGNDADGTIASYQWTKISGPSNYTIVKPTSAATDIEGLVQGVYQFQLTVKDNEGATGADIVQVTVNAAANIPPLANAGPDNVITLPINSLTASGSGSDANGTVSAYQWTKISGPSSYNIVNSTAAVTAINSLVQGIYEFELRVTDNDGARGRDTMKITVNAAINEGPIANAGKDQTITLPTDSVTLSGGGIDGDGLITDYSWKQIAGPSIALITSPLDTITAVTGLIGGTYQFELTVMDNLGTVAKDTVSIVVTEPRLNLNAQNNTIKAYPNPVIDITTVEINTTLVNSKLLLTITDMYNHIVYKKEITQTQGSIKELINMGNMAKGTYVITVYYNDAEKQSIKVVRL